MTESEDVWKSRAEAKMKGLFGAQRIDDEVTNFDKNLRLGLDLSFIRLNDELERWELYGAGVDKLKSAYAENRSQTIDVLSQELLQKVTQQIETINKWREKAENSGHEELLEEYNEKVFEFALFKVLWNNRQEMDIAMRTVETPGFDHTNDLVLKLQKPLT